VPRLAVVLLAVLAWGCDEAAPSVAPTPTRAPEPTPVVTEYRLGTTVWYAGVIVAFDRAVASLDPRGGSVTVQARIENPGSEDALGLEGPIRLVIDGEAFEPTRESQIPDVDPGEIAAVSIEFDVLGHAAADDAVVVIGRDTEHQPRIPFGPAGGPEATFEPLALEVSGAGTAGNLRLRLRSAELRWDLPDWAQQLPSDRASLTLTYDAAYTGSFAGGFPFTGDNVALRLPDETWVRPRADGRSQSIELIGAGKTKRGLRTRFEIPAAMPGEYALIALDGGARRYLVFTVPG
jgi:hypothetical protein